MNPFERYAERVKPRYERRRERIAAKRRRTRQLEAAMIEQAKLERRAHLISEEHLNELLEGPYGTEFQELIDCLAGLSFASGADLVHFIETLRWLAGIDSASVRHEALHLIAGAITRLRERNGLVPFDDPLFEAPPNVFIRIREMLEPTEVLHDPGSDAGLCGGDAEGVEARP
jgi:hypothetical protein